MGVFFYRFFSHFSHNRLRNPQSTTVIIHTPKLSWQRPEHQAGIRVLLESLQRYIAALRQDAEALNEAERYTVLGAVHPKDSRICALSRYRDLGRCSNSVEHTPWMCSSISLTANSTSLAWQALTMARCSASAVALPSDSTICMRR